MDGFISNNKTIIVCTGIAGLVIIEAIALFNGINGTMIILTVGGITGLVGGALGFEIGVKKK